MGVLKFLSKVVVAFATLALALCVLGAVATGALFLYYAPTLPSVSSLGDVHLQVPLKIYTSDHKLIAEYGAERRAPIDYEQIPPRMVQAFISAEDDRFFEHPGVDYQGILRAAIHLVLTGRKTQGGSTITMQVARNFFLSSKKTYSRKIKEIFLALEIDHRFSKQDILQLYLNKIYLGHHAYGVAAAAQTYYGKKPAQLTLAQTAMIAGLPQAPSADNPIDNPGHARLRRDYVLKRMRALDFITTREYKAALAEPVSAELQSQPNTVSAGYVAEMARQKLIDMVGQDKAYTGGYKIITTVDSQRQKAAIAALRDDLIHYSERHGYRGPEGHVDMAQYQGLGQAARQQQWTDLLRRQPSVPPLVAALVVSVHGRKAQVFALGRGLITLGWDALKWAKRYKDSHHTGPAPKAAADVVHAGDLVRVLATGDQQHPWRLSQIPEVQGALVSLDPHDGAVQALVGGFSYDLNKYNRALQAERQPGSSFKPFVYSAALAKGFTPATLISNAPIVYDNQTTDKSWRPENYEQNFTAPVRMRVGLMHSINLVSIRVLRDIGIDYARHYVSRFGVPLSSMPSNLSLALGSLSVTPLEMARAYAVFANGGYLIDPYFIQKILGPGGKVVYRPHITLACTSCFDTKVQSQPQTQPVGLQTLALPGKNAQGSADPATPSPAGTSSTPLARGAPAAMAGDGGTAAPSFVSPAPRVITADNAYLMTSMLHSVITGGTGRAAMKLGRSDLAGKTGTTNQQKDAWFSGFNSDLVTSTWVGFDQLQPLGYAETGARAALPMWIQYMGAALKGMPAATMPRPPGLVTVKIDANSGKPAPSGDAHAMFETFRQDNVPHGSSSAASSGGNGGNGGGSSGNGSGKGWVERLYQ